MGNFSSKDSHGPSGAQQDIFSTPPTSPVTDVPNVSHPNTPQPAPTTLVSPVSPLVFGGTKSKPITSLTTSKPPPDWKPPPPNRGNTLVMGSGLSPLQNKPGSATAPKRQDSTDRNGRPSTSTPRTQVSLGKLVATSPAKSPSSPDSVSPAASPSAPVWRERDSGLCNSPAQGHGVGEDQGEEMERLWEECRTILGSSGSQDTAVNTTELLRCLLTEVKSLRSTLQAERAEWLQFQSDLQVAVAVADRLRAEAEEELTALRMAHKETERELVAAQQRQKEADMQLVTLRGELRESRQRFATLTQTQGKPEVQAPNLAQEKPNPETTTCDIPEQPRRGRERSLYRLGQEGTESGCRSEGPNNVVLPEARMDSKGVAKRYLRNVTNEDRIGEESRTNDPRRVLTTERSRSLSRLPASSDPVAAQNGTSQSNIGTTAGCTNKKQSQPRGLKSMDWQDSWSSTHIGKREDSLNKYNSALTELPSTKSQDGFNLLVRRHGGSKRNSLLRWCQGRTQGYKNIDITNFSSSWVDGLAFCAVYHTYLPSHIPYSTLSPESKRENLNLAFKTGENVGITQSLMVEEMLRAGGPDWQRVLSYVESMYRHFEM